MTCSTVSKQLPSRLQGHLFHMSFGTSRPIRFSVGVYQLAELGDGGFQAREHELSVLGDAGCLIV